MPMLISIVGKKGSGKTEVLSRLITILTYHGCRVGVIKHLLKDHFEIDQPGKDTFRYRSEGAQKVVLSGRKRLAVFANVEEETPLESLIPQFEGYDIVFLENYYQEDLPKIEIHSKESGDLLARELSDVIAICSDEKPEYPAPHFTTEQIELLASFIEDTFLPVPSINAATETRGGLRNA